MVAKNTRSTSSVRASSTGQRSDLSRNYLRPFSSEQVRNLAKEVRVAEVLRLPNIYILRKAEMFPDVWLEQEEAILQTENEQIARQRVVEMTRIDALAHLLTDIGRCLHIRWIDRNKLAKARYKRHELRQFEAAASKILSLIGADEAPNLSDESRVCVSQQFDHLAMPSGKSVTESFQEFAGVLRLLQSGELCAGPVGYLNSGEPTKGKRAAARNRKNSYLKKSAPLIRPKDWLVRIETFYICELWEHFLRQKVATSVNPVTGDAGGPLIRFMCAILSHWHPSQSPSEIAIRERIRRYRDPMGRLVRKKHSPTHLAPNR